MGSRATLWAAALLLLAVACPRGVVAQISAQPSARPADPYFDGRPIQVCTSEYEPVMRCIDRDPSQYSGYDFFLFERLRERMGWASSQINWTCLEWYEMLDHLEAGDGTCDLAMAGVEITNAMVARGFKYSLPTYQGGYKIMVAAQGSTDYWVFLDAFEWQLWLAIGLTCIAVGVIVWMAERWASIHKPTPAGLASLPDLHTRVWNALGRPMQASEMTGSNFSANLVILVFAFMALVLVTLYTANTAANLTAQQLQTRIRGLGDLPGRRVGTWIDPEYVADLERRNVKPLGYAWDTEEDLQAMFDALRSGEINALVLDSYVLDYHAGRNCDLTTVGGVWDEYNQAVAFPSNFDNPLLLADLNRALLSLQESGDLADLAAEHITPQARCKASGVSDTTSQVSFDEVTGLWILLACAVATALCMFLLSRILLCSARRVARSKAYQASLRRVKSAQLRTLTGLQKMSTMQLKRRSVGATQAGGSDEDGCAPYDGSSNEAAANGERPRLVSRADEEQQAMLAAAVDDLAARLGAVQQLVAARRHNGGGSCEGGNALV